MAAPDYLSQIDKVAYEFDDLKYEQKLLNAWSAFEEAARRLPKEYDILDPNIPEEFFVRMSEFIKLLYENDDATAVPSDDCKQIREKDAAYGGSWHSRGGTGAFHALARKGDRLVSMLKKHGDLAGCRKDKTHSESIDDTIGDLRRYLILVCAWHWAREDEYAKSAEDVTFPHDFVRSLGKKFKGPPDETCDVCGKDPRNILHVEREETPPMLIEEEPEPTILFCKTCGHSQEHHDSDGCNGLDTDKGCVCECRQFIALAM